MPVDSMDMDVIESAEPEQSDQMGLGVEIIEIARMERTLSRTPRIKERAFSEDECAWCDSRPNPVVHYALTFAAKAAVSRALGPNCANMGLRDVEVDRTRRGRPRAKLTGVAAAVAANAGVREVLLSLSYTHKTAVASAAAVRDEDVPEPKEQKATTTERIAAQFRNMRTMLDDLGDIAPAKPDEPDARQDQGEETL